MDSVSAFTFRAGEADLVGLIHAASPDATEGVLIVVGGPQYRVGAHRQYVHLARALAAAGIHAMRFDYAGVGDSSGSFESFEGVSTDIRAALDEMKRRLPDLQRIFVWGLCDGASAALLHAAGRPEVFGLMLVNPWVWSEESSAETMVSHYYARRFFDRAFWARLLRGGVNPVAALRGFARAVSHAVQGRLAGRSHPSSNAASYQDRMATALANFSGPTLIILSGNDLVARNFEDRANRDALWQGALGTQKVTIRHIEQADHTLSRGEWKNRLATWTIDWILAGR